MAIVEKFVLLVGGGDFPSSYNFETFIFHHPAPLESSHLLPWTAKQLAFLEFNLLFFNYTALAFEHEQTGACAGILSFCAGENALLKLTSQKQKQWERYPV